ncbi:MAG: transcriptional repressor NrdR [Verrucomicrobiota bacterium]
MIRRRRECLLCEHRYTTYEEIEREEFFVVKRDGRREPFSKDKLLTSIQRACQKRSVSESAISDLVERVTNDLTERFDREVTAQAIGERAMRGLRALDPVAYVRFASIYREFQEVGEFVEEVNRLATLPVPDQRQMALLAEPEAGEGTGGGKG